MSAPPLPAKFVVAPREGVLRATRPGTLLLIACALGLATVAVYLNGLRGPFVFDDIPSIPENPTLRSLWPLSQPLSPPGEGLTVSGRPMLNLSFALNHVAGAGPAGFRATNIAIHFCSGLLLFGLVRRTLLRPNLKDTFGADALPLAAAIAVLWLVHPLQTSAVTYIVQRAESLMAFFYLFTLYAFARGVDSTQGNRWFTLAAITSLLGMATKEVMVSAPLMVALYDRCFVSASWRELWQRRKSWHLALAGTWLLLAWLVIGTGGRGGTTGFSLGVDWLTYATTQCHALVRYLALATWPHPLVFDYGVEWARGASDVAPYAFIVVALVVGTVTAWRRGWPVAWLSICFFAVLAPTSLMPGGRQTMAEHRMYLPLAAVITGLVLLLHRQFGRRGIMVALLASIGLGTVTVRRNADYHSTLALWADTVAKKPANRWARDNLGNALLEAERPAEALAHYEAAIALDPRDAPHHYNAGNALARLGRDPEAIAQFEAALRLDPGYLAARNNLGNALCRIGRFEDALEHYAIVVQAEPKRAENRANLGDALFRAGHTGEAIAELRAAVELQPDNAEFSYGLGCMLLQVDRLHEAVSAFQHALQSNPFHAEAHNNLGSAFAQLGRADDALRHVREAVRLNPQNAEAHNNLGAIYLYLGRRDEALAAFTETLRLAPNHLMARQNIERLRGPGLLR